MLGVLYRLMHAPFVPRLINYTPQATIVRLLTMNAVYAYVTFSILSLTGGFTTPRLFLPGWIGIATVCSPSLCLALARP